MRWLGHLGLFTFPEERPCTLPGVTVGPLDPGSVKKPEEEEIGQGHGVQGLQKRASLLIPVLGEIKFLSCNLRRGRDTTRARV